MAMIRLRKQLGRAVHPNLPELFFECERPNAADVLEYKESMKALDRYEVATHPETHEILRKPNGDPEYIKKEPIFTMEIVTNFLVKHVHVIHGLTDEDDKPVAYNYQTDRERKIAILRGLNEAPFVVKTQRPPNPTLCDRCGKVEKKHEFADHEFISETTEQTEYEGCLQWLTTQVCTERTYRPLDETTSPVLSSAPSEKPPTSVPDAN